MAFTLKSDSVSLLENAGSTGNVLLNDTSATQVTKIKLGSGSYVNVPVAGVTLTGKYGVLTIKSDGSYSYAASTSAADHLKKGSTGSDTFTYSALGGTSSGSTTLKFTVTGVNDAPVLTSTTATLTTINEDQTSNSGQLVSSFLKSSDVDSSALRGVALTGLTSGNGQWQYSLNGGTTWTSVGAVANGAALLLRSTDYIRFVPNGSDGTTANFTYSAWDQTSGSAGAKVNATITGGETAFSTTSATASIAVTAVNDAPVGIPSTASGIEDGGPITGQVSATDVDSSTLTYALVANSAVGGSVTLNASTGAYSFVPAPDFSGVASFRFTASDGSLTSAATAVTITVTGVNDAPVLTATTATLPSLTESQTDNGGQTVASFLQSTDADSNALSGVAVTGLTAGNGQWQYSTNAGASWSAVGTVADGAALLLRSTDYIRFVPNGVSGTSADFTYRAWDQTSGVAGTKVDSATNGGQSAFSTTSGTASIVVTSLNEAPVGVPLTLSATEDDPPITGTVHANDSDSPTLTYALVANSAVGGSVTIDADTGNYSFTLDPDFNGTASFRFTASDGSLTSAATPVTITVAAVNDAPLLTSTTATLAPLSDGQINNGGQTVASFLQSSDVDANALKGVAITGLTSGNGQWQYSTNGGSTWAAVGAVADANALLLRSTDYIRFVPNGSDGTDADFTYRAWDQTNSGAAGSKVDASTTGGDSAFSTASGTASIVVTAINDAPVGVPGSGSGTEDGPPITGTVHATDSDSPTLTYALVANSAVGGTVTIDPDSGDYSFILAPDFSGAASFRFTASDGSLTSAATPVTITVAAVNDAPVLTSTTATLATITESQTNNSGQTVASFLQSSDVDANALKGVAISGLTSGNGQWQYSTNGGSTWSAVGAVASGNALLLRSTDYIRFVPNGVDGTNADFTYRAWDQTSGTAGTKVDASTAGGATAFSTATGTASIIVSSVNDPPVGDPGSGSGTEDGPPITGTVHAIDSDSPTLTYALVANSAVGGSVTIDPNSGDYSFILAPDFNGAASFRFTASDGSLTSAATPVTITVAAVNDAPTLTSTTATLTSITEDQTNNGGQTVSSFLQSSDVDANALKGVAITGLTSGNGLWQYSTNAGSSWSAVGTVTNGGALLLRSTDYVRFVPNGINGTSADFTYRAWDQTSGVAGTKVDAALNGAATSFSTATGTASIVVSAVNDAPVAVAGSGSGSEDGPPITGTLQATDVDSSTLTYALVANSAVGGAVTINPTTGAYSFTAAHDFNGNASFQFTASDGSLSSAATAVTLAIAPVNDAPVAVADSGTTPRDTPLLLNVLANDSDVDGNPLTIASVGSAAHGTVQILSGQVRYVPNAGYVGGDSFTYSISDGAGGTAQSSAAISVTSNGLPSAVSITFRQGANGYTGAADTMLKENVATTSYPISFVLRSGLESGKNEQVLLKFASLFGTGPGQIPVGATIVSATLQVDATGATTDGGTLNRMLVGWSDTSTWSSLGSGVQVNGVEATAAGIAIGAVGLGSHTIDVTESLLAWNAAASTSAGQNAANLGWVFNPTTTDIWDFSSSQGAKPPLLTITYTQQTSLPSLPSVSITAAAPAAENSGKITFNLSLSQAATEDVTVSFSTANHTAIAGSDYVSTSQSVTFLAGQTAKSFDVTLMNNAIGERLEDFTVQINSVTNAKIGTAVATGQILDDDVIVPAMPTLTPSVIHSYDISNGATYKDGGSGQYGISDPSGLAYIPSLGRMFVADSEHDESPFLSPTNLFSLKLDGTYDTNYGLNSFTKEPTGLGYNPNNGYLYIADDDKYAVSWVSPTNPTVRLGSFDTRQLGYLDTEDLKFDPLTGHIHQLDGTLKQMIELTDQGVFVNAVPLASFTTDAEALAYDPVHDLYFVASGASKLIWIINASGAVQATIDIFSSGYSGMKIKGLEYAPSSDPNDGNTMSLYVADYHSDQVNDGHLYEVHLGTNWFG